MFEFGDRGSHYYIIIEGEVLIKTPSPIELDGQKATPEGLLIFIVDYYQDIRWDKISNSDKVQEMFLKELNRLNVEVNEQGYFDTNEALKALDAAISSYQSMIHKNIYQLVNPSRGSTITIPLYKVVATGNAGYSFGELALQDKDNS